MEAHNAYLQGHFYLERRNVDDYRKAIGYYDEAIQLDPEYALAYAERAEAWTILGDLTGQRPTAYRKARSDAEKAVAIAPALAEARAALGFVRCFVDWKFADGLSELKRAKELSPANPPRTICWRESSFIWATLMRLSDRRGRRWNSTLCPL